MNSFTYTKAEPQRASFSIVAFILSLTVILLIGTLLMGAGYSLLYKDRILPGVSVGSVDVSGLSLSSAAQKISDQIGYPAKGAIHMVDGQKTWTITPIQLGYFVDSPASAERAMREGRDGFIFTRLLKQISVRLAGVNLAPVYVHDERSTQQVLVQIANEVNLPVKEASLQLDGLKINVESGSNGRQVDIPATMAILKVQLSTQQDGTIPLVVREEAPLIADLTSQVQQLTAILSQPFTIMLPQSQSGEAGPWVIDQLTLSKMIGFIPPDPVSGKGLTLAINQAQLNATLQGIVGEIDRQPENARFIFNDDTRKLDLIQNGKVGRQVNLDDSTKQIAGAILSSKHQFDLSVVTTLPAVPDNAIAEDYGITELIHQETSYFYGSDASRISNIRTAAGKFHGVMVAPGAVLSMADIMGDVSLDNGYEEALIIFGDQTIKGVGGGVCQVSTTLFRTAFFTGFPILERYAHAYRVGYYEQTASGGHDAALAGLDATVFVPVVDMKFKNDTPYWLLMETYVTDSSLTWKFYSTNDGRTVEMTTTGPTNIKDAPKALYKENPDLPKGRIKQIDYSADGADIDVERTVYKDGQIYFQDSFQTHYVPWQAKYEYGPGTKLPKEARQ